MPVEDSLGRRQSLVLTIARGSGSPVDRVPSDLWLGVLIDASAKGLGDQLRSEADAENRQPPRDGFVDELQLLPDIGEIVVGRHRAAHEDEPIGRAGIGMGCAAVQVHVLIRYRLFLEGLGNHPEALKRDVTERQHLAGHASLWRRLPGNGLASRHSGPRLYTRLQ